MPSTSSLKCDDNIDMLTHREQVLRRYNLPNDTHLSINELSLLTNIPVAALHEVAARGSGAWRTNLASVRLKDFSKNPDIKTYGRSQRLGKDQWKMARIYSFINKGTTYYTADADIARKYNI